MEGAGLNYKKLVTAMSVMTLAAVYTAACIALPRLVKIRGRESGHVKMYIVMQTQKVKIQE